MKTYLRIAGIKEESIVDGPGIRFVVFAQGCRHKCRDCHNQQTHAMTGGFLMSVDDILAQMRRNPLLDGITLSGGDPFEQADGFRELASRARSLGYHVTTYTGYTFEQLLGATTATLEWKGLLENSDILVDGPFIKALHDPLLVFRGSSNQRLVDVASSLAIGALQTLTL